MYGNITIYGTSGGGRGGRGNQRWRDGDRGRGGANVGSPPPKKFSGSKYQI